MSAAVDGAAWSATTTQCGLYSAVAGRCQAGALDIAVPAHAQSTVPPVLPESVAAELRAARVPLAAVAITLVPLSGSGITMAINEHQSMNPASTMKIATTMAGLELLGPQHVWRTEALVAAPLQQGVLEGDLWLRGSGDPRLVVEDLWLLVQRIRGSGVREIRGDLVLDRSAHEPMGHNPAAFDGEALRPYNAGPDALLLNYKAVSFHFVPDTGTRQVRVYALPAVAGMVVPSTVKTAEGACNDWRGRVGGDFADPMRPQFRGVFPLSCGDKVWHVNLFTPVQYAQAVFRPLWEASGGTWRPRAGCPPRR